MAIANAVQNTMLSAIGSVNRAVLCIRAVGSLGEVKPFGEVKDGKPQMSEDAKKGVADAIELEGELKKKATAALEGDGVAGFAEIKKESEKHGYIALGVQYNPTSLRLDTTAGKQMKYSGDASNPQLQQYKAPSSTTLSFELLFDDVNNMDAFAVSDNPITGLTVSNAVNAVTSAVKGKYSVQSQMEGLLSLLTIEQARHVIFFWAGMCFRGEVTAVSTTYTMFNKKGYPIRGKLGMQIRQGDRGYEENYNYDESYWIDAFEQTFRDKKTSEKVMGGISMATNNAFLNLKL